MQLVGWNKIPQKDETIVLMTNSDIQVLKDFVEEAISYSMVEEEQSLGIFECTEWTNTW